MTSKQHAENLKVKYGEDYYKNIGKKGGKKGGYFGWLKSNDPQKLKEIQAKSVASRIKKGVK